MAREIIFYENDFLDFYIPLENKVKIQKHDRLQRNKNI